MLGELERERRPAKLYVGSRDKGTWQEAGGRKKTWVTEGRGIGLP